METGLQQQGPRARDLDFKTAMTTGHPQQLLIFFT